MDPTSVTAPLALVINQVIHANARPAASQLASEVHAGMRWAPTSAACDRERLKLRVGADEATHLNAHMEDVGVVTPVQPLPTVPAFLWLSPHPCSAASSVLAERLRFGLGWEFDPLVEHLLRRPPEGAIVIDAGANMGGYTLLPAAMGVPVVSIELQARRVRALRMSALANGWLNTMWRQPAPATRPHAPLHLPRLPTALHSPRVASPPTPPTHTRRAMSRRVHIHHTAIGGPADVGSFLSCANLSTASVTDPGRCHKIAAVSRHESGASTVPFATLDSFAPAPSFVQLLKLDCDGCEPAAYGGLTGLLTQRRVRYVMAELCGTMRDEGWFTDLWTNYRPQVYVISIGVNVQREGCSHFQGVHAHTFSAQRLRNVLARRPAQEDASHVTELNPLLRYLRHCDRCHISPNACVTVDVLIKLRVRGGRDAHTSGREQGPRRRHVLGTSASSMASGSRRG